MRVTGGKFRGRSLLSPKNFDIRPTSDKVRAAIFNALACRLSMEGIVVLDGFCGTGALGIEALSRGADLAIFCDISPRSLALAKSNICKLEITKQAEFQLGNALLYSKCPATIDLVFVDPPYRKNLVIPFCQHLLGAQIVKPNSFIVIESEAGLNISELMMPHGANLYMECVFDKIYGDTSIRFLRACSYIK